MSAQPPRADHDDEVSYTDMNIPGMRGYRDPAVENQRTQIAQVDLTGSERRAIIKAGCISALPRVGLFVAGFVIAAFLMYLWLS